jgi:hypothetical protein
VRWEPLSNPLHRGASLILVPEVEARRVLSDRRIRLRVLAPYGSWIGCGRLRVLRLALRQAEGDTAQGDIDESDVELMVGYEAYQT